MEEIKVIYSFELENGNTRLVSVKDMRSDIDEAQLVALGNMMIDKGGEYNGSKFVKLLKIQRVVTNKETFII
ncbi:MAG: hypothetical protein FWC47_01175 [Oscillospiraceae bacterium]|nr:hypothetical protein [Oscillospiraceae bacterium]